MNNFSKTLMSALVVLFVGMQTALAEGQLVSTTPQIVQKGSITVAGTQKDYKMSAPYSEIFQQWNAGLNTVKSVPGNKNNPYYTGLSQAKSWTQFTYIAGVEVSGTDGLPANVVTMEVPAKQYAKFTYKGDLQSYGAASDAILDKHIKTAKLKWDQKAPIIEEFKTASFTPGNINSANNVIDVYVPLK
jgi:AraC family transcriptional regulator